MCWCWVRRAGDGVNDSRTLEHSATPARNCHVLTESRSLALVAEASAVSLRSNDNYQVLVFLALLLGGHVRHFVPQLSATTFSINSFQMPRGFQYQKRKTQEDS